MSRVELQKGSGNNTESKQSFICLADITCVCFFSFSKYAWTQAYVRACVHACVCVKLSHITTHVYVIVQYTYKQTNIPKQQPQKPVDLPLLKPAGISCWLTCSFDGSSVPQNCVLFWQTLGLKVLTRRQYLMTASLREGRLVSGIKLPQRKEQPLPSQVNYWNVNKKEKMSKQSTFMFFATSVM